MWVVAVVFEFADGEPEQRVVHRGDRETCERLAARLERDALLGIRGVRYDGDRGQPPVQAVVAVCRGDALEPRP